MKWVYLPPLEYLKATEMLNPLSLESFPYRFHFLKSFYTFSFCQETHLLSTSVPKGNKYPPASAA